GIQILRQIQLDFPGSEADQTIRSSPNIANLLGPDGVLRENVNEGDFTEAFKAALDAAVNTPPGRRLGIAALFLLVLAVIDPEPSTKVVLLTLLGAAVTDSAIGVITNTDSVMSAYKTGISNVSMRESARNLCMLALDLAVWIPAGYVGKLAGTATKAGLSYTARLGARLLPSMEIPFFAKQALRGLGELVMVGAPFVIETNVAGITHAAGHSLLTGTDLHWNVDEAVLMMIASGSDSLAKAVNLGGKVSKSEAMQWISNTAVGGSIYYGALWGIDQWKGTKYSESGLLATVSGQFQTMAPVHLGNKLVAKSGVLKGIDGLITKIDRKGNAWLADAKAEMSSNNGSGGPWGGLFGGFGLQPALATAGGRLPVRFSDIKPEASSPVKPMAMVSHGGGKTLRPADGTSTPVSGDSVSSKLGSGEVFVEGKKENTLKFPEDAAKLEIKDGSHGKVVIERDPSTGGFRIHNHSDRSVYVGSAKGEIKPGKSGTAANASRVRLGNGWYRLNAAEGTSPATRDYRTDLPKQSGDLPGQKGEIHDVTDEPTTVFDGNPTAVETAEPTFVDTAPPREPLPEGEGNVHSPVGWEGAGGDQGTNVGNKAARRTVKADQPVETPRTETKSEDDATVRFTESYLDSPPVRSDVELVSDQAYISNRVRIYVETPEARTTVIEGLKAKHPNSIKNGETKLLVNMGETLYVTVEVMVDPYRSTFVSPDGDNARSGGEVGSINVGKDAAAAMKFMEPYFASPDVAGMSVGEGRIVVRSVEARKALETEMEAQATKRGLTFKKIAGQEGMYYVTYYSGAKGARVKSTFHLKIEVDPSAPARGKLYDYGQKPKGGDDTAPGE
ncbi:MAG TPA: hypothetical protein VFX30_09560, partial [bacterium]|nr:hypothetical protein [bacterium]